MGNVLSSLGMNRQKIFNLVELELKDELEQTRKELDEKELQLKELGSKLKHSSKELKNKDNALRSVENQRKQALADAAKKAEHTLHNMKNAVQRADMSETKLEVAKQKLRRSSKLGDAVMIRLFMEKCRKKATDQLRDVGLITCPVEKWNEWVWAVGGREEITPAKRFLSTKGLPVEAYAVMSNVIDDENERIHAARNGEQAMYEFEGALTALYRGSPRFEVVRSMF